MMNETTKINGIEISNPQKLMYKSPKVTKLDLVKYYNEIAEKMLPYIKNRLLSFISCPQGTMNKAFLQKHLTHDIYGVLPYTTKDSDNNETTFYYIKDKKGLLSLIQNNVVELHIWGSTIDKVDYPDYMIFDLDPDTKMSIDRLHEAVKLLHKLLQELHLRSFIKTSGKKGYHIMVKMDRTRDFTEVKDLSLKIATVLRERYPDMFTTNISKAKRKGKIFIDYLRNSKGATTVAPYSIRINSKPTISYVFPYSQLEKTSPSLFMISDI